MSILIKDMEMPNNCKECQAYICYRQWSGDAGDEFCGLTKNNVPSEGMPYWCPLSKPEPQWIPCSERLPEYMEPVLTWDGEAYAIEKRIPVIRDDDGEPIEGDWWVSDEYDEYGFDYYPGLRDGACIAWMPLPEPYREEGE